MAAPTPTLSGRHVVLRPMLASDAQALVDAAADGELWALPFTVVPSAQTVHTYIDRALEGQRQGHVMPFVTTLRDTGEIIGSSRFWKIDPGNRKLEIGHTWLSRSWQRSFANTEAKLLMLGEAFDIMGCIRVQLTTDERNLASRAAILRLGAQQEGILRHERIMPDGHKRNSVRFSIIDDEWPEVKQRLQQRLGQGLDGTTQA